MPDFGRLLIFLGLILLLLGGLLLLLGRAGLSFGRLPGDIRVQGPNGSFFFPVVSCLVLSALVSLVLYVVGRLRR